MRKCLVFCLLISNCCFAQKENFFCLKVSPLSFITPYTGPSLRIGTEFKLKNTYSFCAEFGTFVLGSKGYLFKPELRYYLPSETKLSGEYFGVELFFKNQSYVADYTQYDGDTVNHPGVKQNGIFNVQKNVECFTLKYGEQTITKFGLLIDMYCGLGIRLQQNRNSLTASANNALVSSSDYGPNLMTDKAGNRVYPNLVAGIRIGFAFNRWKE